MSADLVSLKAAAPDTTVHFALRRATLAGVLGVGERNPLMERSRLGQRVREWVEQAVVNRHASMGFVALESHAAGIIACDGD